MEKRKYKLDTAGCTSKLVAVKVIVDNLHLPLKEAKDAFDTGDLECSPSEPGYRKMIEDLEEVGVLVYDLERIQFPKLDPAEPKTLT